MPFLFPLMNNQATFAITTFSSNTLVTLTSFSTITTTFISSASSMVSINPAPPMSVAATGQDANFETTITYKIFEPKSSFHMK